MPKGYQKQNKNKKNKKQAIITTEEKRNVPVKKYVGTREVQHTGSGAMESVKMPYKKKDNVRTKSKGDRGAAKLLKDPVARGTLDILSPNDTRIPGSDFAFDDGIIANGTNDVCPVNAPLNLEACKWAIKGLVDEAVRAGWAQSLYSENQDWPGQALVFGTNVLISGAISGIPIVSTVPHWLACILQSLKGGEAWSDGCKYNFQWYSAVRPGEYSFDTKLPYGPQGSDVFAVYGAPGDQIGNTGFTQVNMTTYDPLRGQNAWNSMLEYLKQYGEQMNKTRSPANASMSHALESSSAANKFTNDRSAFAVVTSVAGGGSSASGTVAGRIGLEVAIKTPLMSHFTQQVTSAAASLRCPVHSEPAFGDASAVALLCNRIPENDVRKLRYGKIHFFDFNEFLNTVNLFLVEAIKMALNDPENRLILDLENPSVISEDMMNYFPSASFEEFALLIRHNLMGQVSSTQHYFQGTFPNASGNGNFTPFSSASNSIHLAGVPNINVPLYLSEVIKAIRGKYREAVKNAEGKMELGPINFRPSVLGARYSDVVSADSYVVDVERQGQKYSYAVYPAAAEDKKKKAKDAGSPSVKFPPPVPPVGKKVHRVHAPKATLGVSLFDGQYSGGFAVINDPAKLSLIASEWNRLMSVLSPYVQQLTPLYSDEGIAEMSNVDKTRFVTNVPAGARKGKGLADTYADQYGIVVDSSARPEFAAFHEIANILPCYTTQDKQSESADITNFRVSMRESSAINTAYTQQNVALSNIHKTIAVGCVKARDGEDGEQTKFMQRCAARGQAGVGDGIVNIMSNPAVQTLVGGAGNMLGGLVGSLFGF